MPRTGRHSGRGNPQNLVPQFADLAHALRGVDLPQSKRGLENAARKNGAEQDVMQIISAMPEGDYTTMADVIAAASGERGARSRH